MATYRIENPDGSVYQVDIPEDSQTPAPGPAGGQEQPPTLGQLPLHEKLFTPANLTREGLAAILGQQFRAAGDVFNATGPGMAMQATLPPGIKQMVAQAPQQMAQTVGTAASLPLDPGTYAAAGINRIPSAILRAALGAGTGILEAAGQPGQVTGTQLAVGAGLGGAGAAMTRVRNGQVDFELPSPKKTTGIVDFLRGNPKGIAEAQRGLEDAAHETVLSMRPGGKLHDKVMGMLSQESNKAWQPMREVTGAIAQPTTVDELKQALKARFTNAVGTIDPEDVGRLNAAEKFLDDSTQKTFTGPELADLSTEVGQFMKKAGLRGTAARTFSDMIYSDVRSAIADTIQAKAPPEMQGFVQQAKQQWADYATDRDLLFRYFKPGGSRNMPTDQGVGLLTRAIQDKANASERGFIARFGEHMAEDVHAPLKVPQKILDVAMRKGAIGRKITKIGELGLGAYAAGRVARTVFGRNNSQ